MRGPQLPANRPPESAAAEYATADDIQRYLASDITELFHLALLLTADIDQAEQCMILVIRECLATDCTFRDWLPVWVRRMVVKTGIEIVTGNDKRSPRSIRPDRAGGLVSGPVNIAPALEDSAGILMLNDYERLVYVLSTIEQYPLRECALLLGSSTQEVRDARTSAMAATAAFENDLHDIAGTTLSERSAWSISTHLGSDFDFFCGTVLG